MSDDEKKKLMRELYLEFKRDMADLDKERLAFMKQVIARIETKKTQEVLSQLQ